MFRCCTLSHVHGYTLGHARTRVHSNNDEKNRASRRRWSAASVRLFGYRCWTDARANVFAKRGRTNGRARHRYAASRPPGTGHGRGRRVTARPGTASGQPAYKRDGTAARGRGPTMSAGLVVAVAAVLLLSRPSLRADGGGVTNVDIGRGVDVLQRFGIIGDMLFGDALFGDVSNAGDTRTHDLFNDAGRFTEVFNLTRNNTNLFNLTFCPDLDCLFNVYFDGFQVELSDTPWKLLTTSRQSHFISERFGVPEMAMELGQKFVIVSYKRPVKRVKMVGNLTQLAELKPTMVEKLKCTSVGIESMVTDFITEFGSHYIDEYTVGDSVFQVLVYLPVFYNRFYGNCVLRNCSESETTKWLSPVFTEYQGQVMRVGSNDAVDKWINSNLLMDSQMGDAYVSLYGLKNRPDLCDEIVALMDDRAVVGVHLKVISSLIADPAKRKWFREVLDNHVKLREVNL